MKSKTAPLLLFAALMMPAAAEVSAQKGRAAPNRTRPASRPVSQEAAAATIRDVKRVPLPDGIRISIEMDAEALYYAERLENPRRVFFDINGARPSAALKNASLKFTDNIVREIRIGLHPNTTRVVMDMEGAESYSVFTLYDPFRLVVDFKRSANAPPPPVATTHVVEPTIIAEPKPLPMRPTLPPVGPLVPSPAPPAANRD